MKSTTSFRRTARLVGLMAAAFLTLPSALFAQATRTAPLAMVRAGGAANAQIGVTIRDVTDADATAAKLTAPAGAFVQDVRSESPASRAGLRTGDVVVTFDGERVRSAAHFARLVDETPAGRAIQTVVQRGGERVTLNVAPEAAGVGATVLLGREGRRHLEDLTARISPRISPRMVQPPLEVFGSPARLGVTIQELNGQLGEYFGASSGVLVTAVTDQTPARTAGLRAGDVITRVNGQAVSSGLELRRRLTDATGDVSLTVIRDRKEQTLTVTLPERPLERRTIVR